MFNIVLFEPEIPSNTGNIGRTCVVTGSKLHLIKPYGFELSDPLLKRAGMAYWPNLGVAEYDSWDDFLARNPQARLHLLTKWAERTYTDAAYTDGDFLVFGKKSTGLPASIREAYTQFCERIPMLPDAASLDNASVWHARHEQLSVSLHPDIAGNMIDDAVMNISSLNLSNAVSIVLYEALRQTGFKGM